jgi:hypothetical protein
MPADRADAVAEKLRSCWESLVKHEKEMASGADKQFCDLVKKCVDELWEEVVERGTWQNQWRDTLVWQKIEFEQAGEAERRIREKVRPWLAEARRLKYKKWWFTESVDRVGSYVDQWVAGGTDGASADSKSAQEATKASEAGEAGAGGEAGAVWRDVQRLERQNRALAEAQAGLKEEQRRLVQERDALRVVERQKRQIAELELMAGVTRAQPGVRVEALLRELCASA